MSKLRFVDWIVHNDTLAVAVTEEGPCEALMRLTHDPFIELAMILPPSFCQHVLAE